MNRMAGAALSGLAVLALAGCGGGTDGGTDGGSGSGAHSEGGTLTVLAAASLTESFTTLAKDFEADHPGVKVRLTFDSSATLAEQVVQGAPADVLATADETTMQTVVDQHGTAGTPKPFATNHLELVVPADNPARITRFADLGHRGVKYVVCVPSAPCGKLAVTLLRANGITTKPASEEVDVKAVLSKVQLDEADAGLVYATDAKAGGARVHAVDVPASGKNRTEYPVAALAEAQHPGLARAWLALVTGQQGRRVLGDAGFGPP